MEILLIRHAHTVLDRTKPNEVWVLSDAGVANVKQYQDNAAVRDCSKIYCSFQTKAIETALILAKPNYIPLVPDNSLNETSSVTNGFFDNYDEQMRKWHQGGYRINKGETKEEALLRFNEAVGRIINENPYEKRLGIVSHCNVLACFSEQFLDQDSYSLHNKIAMPDLALFDTESSQFKFVWGSKIL